MSKVVIKWYTNWQPNYYEKFELDNEPEFKRIYKVFWNPLTLKHLMMYCNEKGINIIYYNWALFSWAIFQTLHSMPKICDLDHTKELYEQEDKVLLDIINFLKG